MYGDRTRSNSGRRPSSAPSRNGRDSGRGGGLRRRRGSKFPLWLKILIIVLSAALVGVILYFVLYFPNHNRRSPEGTVKSFIYAARHSDISGMIDYIDPTEAAVLELVVGKGGENSIGGAAAKKILSDFVKNDLYSYLNPEILSCEENNMKATVKVKIDIKDVPHYYDFHLIKGEWATWYIQYILSSDS